MPTRLLDILEHSKEPGKHDAWQLPNNFTVAILSREMGNTHLKSWNQQSHTAGKTSLSSFLQSFTLQNRRWRAVSQGLGWHGVPTFGVTKARIGKWNFNKISYVSYKLFLHAYSLLPPCNSSKELRWALLQEILKSGSVETCIC